MNELQNEWGKIGYPSTHLSGFDYKSHPFWFRSDPVLVPLFDRSAITRNKSEDRGQKTEDRGQRTEDRRPN